VLPLLPAAIATIISAIVFTREPHSSSKTSSLCRLYLLKSNPAIGRRSKLRAVAAIGTVVVPYINDFRETFTPALPAAAYSSLNSTSWMTF